MGNFAYYKYVPEITSKEVNRLAHSENSEFANISYKSKYNPIVI